MGFFKKIFKDDSTIIGLCGFDKEKISYNKNLAKTDFFFNNYQTENVFETNFEKNVLLF